MANISVVGASGIVGLELLKLLESKKFPISRLSIYGSDQSFKKEVTFSSQKIRVRKLSEATFTDDDLVFFCTPSEISKKYVPVALKSAKNVIDLSSAYREDKNACLCIPGINQNLIKRNRLFASPNCVASILSLVLFPLHKLFKLKTIIASTYQAVSGGGYNLLNTLIQDTKAELTGQKKQSSAFNVYLHNSNTFDDGYNAEEKKIISELKQILDLPDLAISVTAARVPSLRCHSISCHIITENKVDIKKAESVIKSTPGVKTIEGPTFATCNDAANQESIFCSRIRKVPFNDNALELWVVGDQLLKGAALNAYQIANFLQNQL